MIAINNLDYLDLIYQLLQYLIEHPIKNGRVIFRPHMSVRQDLRILELTQAFEGQEWFVYDQSPMLSVLAMQEACTLIGDYSSLVYTFVLTTLKPAILLYKDEAIFQNHYEGIGFFHPTLHLRANSLQALLDAINKSKQDLHKRAEAIKAYRQREVFCLRHSSQFIANFIIKLLERNEDVTV